MQLDRESCQRARIARDPRFDGCFFTAVKTTRIYCRPICPAPSPKEQNVVYYPRRPQRPRRDTDRAFDAGPKLHQARPAG